MITPLDAVLRVSCCQAVRRVVMTPDVMAYSLLYFLSHSILCVVNNALIAYICNFLEGRAWPQKVTGRQDYFWGLLRAPDSGGSGCEFDSQCGVVIKAQ